MTFSSIAIEAKKAIEAKWLDNPPYDLASLAVEALVAEGRVVGAFQDAELERLRVQATELEAELHQRSEDVTGACLARWEEEQDNARLRLALKSARRGRRQLRAVVEWRTTLLRDVQKIARGRIEEARGREAYGKRMAAENAELLARIEVLERAYTVDTAALKQRVAELEQAAGARVPEGLARLNAELTTPDETAPGGGTR